METLPAILILLLILLVGYWAWVDMENSGKKRG